MQGVPDGASWRAWLRGGSSSRLVAIAFGGAIALLAIWLRWDRLQYTEFGPDQSAAMGLAYDAVANVGLPIRGVPNSVGGVQGPVEILLLTLPVAISTNPLLATAFIGILQVFAIIATQRVVTRYFGTGAGVAAAFLFAVNPWALHYSRKIWTPESLPLFIILFFGALYASVVARQRHGLPLACLCLTLACLTHPQAVGFAPVLLLAAVWRWRQFGARPFLFGLGLAALVAAPYLYYQSQIGFFDFRAIFSRAAGGNAVTTLESLQYVVTMASASGFPELLLFGFRSPSAYPDLTVANWLVMLLLVLGLALCLWRVVPRRAGGVWRSSADWEKYMLLLLWFAVPVALHLRHNMDLYPHYFIYVLPAQYVLIGVALAWLGGAAATVAPRLRLEPRYLGVGVAGGCVLFLGLSQVLFFRTYLDHIETLGPVRPYGTPLVFIQRAMDTMRSLRTELSGPSLQVYGFLHRDPLDYLARPDVELHHVDRPFEVMLSREPGSGQLAVLCADDATFAWRPDGTLFDFHATKDDGPIVPGLLDLGFTELTDRTIRGPDGFVYFRFFYLPPAEEARAYAAFTKPEASFVLSNGMRLVGYSFIQRVQAGGTAWVKLLWDLPRDRSGYPYAQHNVFVHAVDRRGTVVAQKDWELVQYLDWRVDGLVLTEHQLPIPPDATQGVLWLDLGAYERFGRQAVAWRDAAGKEVGQALKVGPVTVVAASAPTAPETAVRQRFGDWLELDGYDLAQPLVQAGEPFEVRLHWRAVAQPPGDYVVSVQLLAPDGHMVAQHDSPPAEGDFPTSYWAAGEHVVDVHRLSLPEDLSSGQYAIQVVVYSAQGQKRLPVGGTDRLDLATLRVK